MISTCRMSDPSACTEAVGGWGVMTALHSSSGFQGRTPEDMEAHQRHVHLETGGGVCRSLTLKCHEENSLQLCLLESSIMQSQEGSDPVFR